MAEERVEIDQDEFDSFIQKLNAFSESLDEGEKVLLAVLMGRARGGSEVDGFVNTAGTVRVNNLANLEALLNAEAGTVRVNNLANLEALLNALPR